MTTPRILPPTPEEKELFLAEAKRALAEAAKAEWEAQKAKADAATAAIKLEREQHGRTKELAEDEFHHLYRFTSSVSDSSVRDCIKTLQTWSRIDPGCAITIIYTSPGGEIISGMALFDFLQELRADGHKITAIARGYAASMAGILLQAAYHRAMGAEAWLLIHEASFGAGGSFADVDDTVKWIEKIQERILTIFANRSAAADSKTATDKLSKNQIKRRWHRKDWWIPSDEALAHGFVDEIR